MLDYTPNDNVKKLILLFMLEKIDIPLTKHSILDICTSLNSWLNYMECADILEKLSDVGFVYASGEEKNEKKYKITYEGQSCLAYYFQRIPASIRTEITDFCKANRMNFKRSQEYVADFKKLDDGSFVINFKIQESNNAVPLLDLKMKANNRNTAIAAFKKWKDKAPKVYEALITLLLDE